MTKTTKSTKVSTTKQILWVDDFRDPPTNLCVDIARTYSQAIEMLSTTNYDEIYLDHDLGDFSGPNGREMRGYDVVVWLMEHKEAGGWVPSVYHYLTSNPVGRANMKFIVDNYLLT